MGRRIKCDECHGTGITSCPLEYDEDKHPSQCPACGGTNKVRCPDCEGCGYIDEDTHEPMP